MIVIVFGLPGSGKSFFASKLAEKTGAEYLNSDQIRLSIFPERQYTEAEKMKVYTVMADQTEKLIRKERDVVLDATFYKEHLRENFRHLAKSNEVPLLFIEVIARESIIKERLNRKRVFSEADYPVYLTIKESFEPLSEDHLILESTQENIDWMLKQALDHIKKSHGKRGNQ